MALLNPSIFFSVWVRWQTWLRRVTRTILWSHSFAKLVLVKEYGDVVLESYAHRWSTVS